MQYSVKHTEFYV